MSTSTTELYYSAFGGDPDMTELVEMFVDELPDRVTRLEDLLRVADWDELGRFAHQLKGACGSYGFEALTPLAARLERTARGGEPESHIYTALVELTVALRRVRAGSPVKGDR